MPAAQTAEAAIGQLAERCSRRAFAIAYDLLRNPADAEDAVQEALVRAIKEFGSLREPAALEAWFFRSLTNLCLKIIRRRKVRHRLSHLLRRGHTDPPTYESRLLAALESLPAKQHAAVVLRHAHGCSVAEVAELLGVRPTTAKTHLSRGLAGLRQKLGGDHDTRK